MRCCPVPTTASSPLLQVRSYVNKQLAAQLRPELEAAVKANDSPPSEVFSPDFTSAARRDLKNKALALLATLEDPQVTSECLRRCREAGRGLPSAGAGAVALLLATAHWQLMSFWPA